MHFEVQKNRDLYVSIFWLYIGQMKAIFFLTLHFLSPAYAGGILNKITDPSIQTSLIIQCLAAPKERFCKDTWILRSEAEKYFQSHEKDLIAFRFDNQQTVIQHAIASLCLEHCQSATSEKRMAVHRFVKRLVSSGADINSVGSMGLTALHDTVLSLDENTMKFLIGIGASPEAKAGPGKFHEKKPIEFANFLQKKSFSQARARFIQLLNQETELKDRSRK